MNVDSRHATARAVWTVIAILVILVVLSICSLYGVVYTARAASRSEANGKQLTYNAIRGDCIRQITADDDQQFREDIAGLLAAGRDSARFEAAARQLEEHAAVNYADAVKKTCAPAIPGDS